MSIQERLVNGRPFSVAMQELRQRKEPPHELPNGVKYFKSEEYFDLFDRVIGPVNYSVEYSDFKYTPTQIGTAQELFSVKCCIVILDDDGLPILAKEGYGGYVCRYNNKDNKDVNLQNAPDFVCSYAFKTAAKKFGAFGFVKGSEEGDSKPAANGTPARNTNNRQRNDVLFRTEGALFVEKEDEKGTVYKVNAHVVEGNVAERAVSQIIFYPDKYRKYASIMNILLTECSDDCSKRIRINTTLVGERNGVKQYVFVKAA